MSKKATISASGLSLALGLANMSALSGLTSSVEELKASMTPPVDTASTTQNRGIDLFGSASPGQTIVSSGNDEVDAMAARAVTAKAGIDELAQRAIDATTVKENTASISTKLEDLESSIQNVSFDVETLVGIASSTIDFATKWDLFGTRAYVDDDDTTHLSDCKLGFVRNRGNNSAVHFAGLDDNAWAMYTSTPVGKSTDESSPQAHSGVSGNAVRMKVGNGATEGFVIEAHSGAQVDNLLSVDSNGKAIVSSVALGNPGDHATVSAGYSNKEYHSVRDCAVYQEKNGPTKINCAYDSALYLGNNSIGKIKIGVSGTTMDIANKSGSSSTKFNDSGHNTIVCQSSGSSRFRSGEDETDRLRVSTSGVGMEGVLRIDGVSMNEMIRALTSRISAAETASGKTAGSVIDFKR